MPYTSHEHLDKARHEYTHVKPHHGALHIEETSVQPISISEIDGSHSGSPSSVVSLVVALDGFLPIIPNTAVAILPKADINQEVAEAVVRFEVGRLLCRSPLVDIPSEQCWGFPASKRSSALRFVIK